MKPLNLANVELDAQHLIDAGLAREYRGRLIPVISGGEFQEGEATEGADPGSYAGIGQEVEPQQQPEAWSSPYQSQEELNAALQAQEAQGWNAALEEAEAYYSQLYSGQEQQPVQAPAPEPQDPTQGLNDPQFEEALNRMVEQRFQERFGPIEPLLGMFAQQAGEQQAQQQLELIANGDPARGIPGIGEFDREQALAFGRAYADAGYEADQAAYWGAVRAQQFEQKVRAAAYEEFRGQLENGQAGGNVPALSAGGEQSGPNDPGSYDEAFARALAPTRTPAIAG